MTTKNLLVELFVEELPPKALKRLGDAFASGLASSLKSQGLADDASSVTSFASPRRLAVHVTAVSGKAADRQVQQKLMPVAVGLNAEGQATPALLKKLAALGVDLSVVPTLKRQRSRIGRGTRSPTPTFATARTFRSPPSRLCSRPT